MYLNQHGIDLGDVLGGIDTYSQGTQDGLVYLQSVWLQRNHCYYWHMLTNNALEYVCQLANPNCAGSKHLTAASQLINYLKLRQDLTYRYIALWDDPNPTSLITITCTSPNGEDEKCYKLIIDKLDDQGTRTQEESDTDKFDPSGEFAQYIERMHCTCSLPDCKRFLFDCILTTDSLHRKLCMYQNMLTFDVLEKMNIPK
jgi:hypothetical protein